MEKERVVFPRLVVCLLLRRRPVPSRYTVVLFRCRINIIFPSFYTCSVVTATQPEQKPAPNLQALRRLLDHPLQLFTLTRKKLPITSW